MTELGPFMAEIDVLVDGETRSASVLFNVLPGLLSGDPLPDVISVSIDGDHVDPLRLQEIRETIEPCDLLAIAAASLPSKRRTA